MSKKVIVLVIDGLGIGSMEDSKDKGANALDIIYDKNNVNENKYKGTMNYQLRNAFIAIL